MKALRALRSSEWLLIGYFSYVALFSTHFLLPLEVALLVTSLLAVLAYSKAGYVSWQTGLLLIPGVFLGGIAGGNLARRIPAAKMRRIFAALIFLLGIWHVVSAVRG